MARVNITVPDDVLAAAKAAGVNVSRVSSKALSDELLRQQKVAALERYLDDLEVEHGPVSDVEAAAARQWVDQLAPSGSARSSQTDRTA